MRTSTPLAAAILAIGLTACGGESETSAGPAASEGSPPPVEDSTPAQTTAAALPTGPHARDGFNYPACKDARCEIYVRTGTKVPLKQSVAGFGTLLVSKATASGVDFTGKNPDTTGSVGQQPGYRARIGKLDVVTVTVNQRHPAGNGVETLAILRLSPA